MTSCFVCATLNLGRKKSTGTEPKLLKFDEDRLKRFKSLHFYQAMCVIVNQGHHLALK